MLLTAGLASHYCSIATEAVASITMFAKIMSTKDAQVCITTLQHFCRFNFRVTLLFHFLLFYGKKYEERRIPKCWTTIEFVIVNVLVFNIIFKLIIMVAKLIKKEDQSWIKYFSTNGMLNKGNWHTNTLSIMHVSFASFFSSPNSFGIVCLTFFHVAKFPLLLTTIYDKRHITRILFDF